MRPLNFYHEYENVKKMFEHLLTAYIFVSYHWLESLSLKVRQYINIVFAQIICYWMPLMDGDEVLT